MSAYCNDCRSRPARDGHDSCFKCHLSSISIGFGGRGKQHFHDHTIKGLNDEAAKDVAASMRESGRNIEPLPMKATF